MPDRSIFITEGNNDLAELYPAFSATNRNHVNKHRLMLSFHTTDPKKMLRVIKSISTPSALRWFFARGIREIAGITRNEALIQFMLRHYPTRIDVPSRTECGFIQLIHLLRSGEKKRAHPKYEKEPFRLMVTPIQSLLQWSRIPANALGEKRSRNFAEQNALMRANMAKGLFPTPEMMDKDLSKWMMEKKNMPRVIVRQKSRARRKNTAMRRTARRWK